MHEQFFDSDGNSDDPANCTCFNNCKLKIDMGPFKAGAEIPCISIDYIDGIMTFWTGIDGETETKFKLKLELI